MKDGMHIKLISAQGLVANFCPDLPENIEKVIKSFKGSKQGLDLAQENALTETSSIANFISDVVQSLQMPGLTENQRNDLFSVALERVGPETEGNDFGFGLKAGLKN